MKILAIALAIVVYLGFQHQWYFILSGDIKNYYFPIASHVFTSHTLIYPPGANLFFLVLPAISFNIYQLTFIAVNILLILGLNFLTKKPHLLALILLCAGPIVLFRFDLLVITLIILGLWAFQKEKMFLSGIFIAAAVATKLFPLVLLPYLLLATLSFQMRLKFLAAFGVALVLIVSVYLGLTRIPLQSVYDGFSFSFSQSVQMESVPGSFLTLATFFTNPGPHSVDFINARWVLSPLYYLGHARIFRVLVPGVLAGVYLAVIWRSRKNRVLSISSCVLIILGLVIASQAFSPQYVLWPVFLLLLVPIKELATNFWRVNLALILLALICTQVIYPLNYGEFIDFYNRGINQHLFWINSARNFSLIILAARLFRHELSV